MRGARRWGVKFKQRPERRAFEKYYNISPFSHPFPCDSHIPQLVPACPVPLFPPAALTPCLGQTKKKPARAFQYTLFVGSFSCFFLLPFASLIKTRAAATAAQPWKLLSKQKLPALRILTSAGSRVGQIVSRLGFGWSVGRWDRVGRCPWASIIVHSKSSTGKGNWQSCVGHARRGPHFGE